MTQNLVLIGNVFDLDRNIYIIKYLVGPCFEVCIPLYDPE